MQHVHMQWKMITGGTDHTVFFGNSSEMGAIKEGSVDLVVTSPPYPMISMWDSFFSSLNPKIGNYLETGEGKAAYELMHSELDRTWFSLHRLIRPGGFVCINIGDATRKIGNDFSLYPSHTRVIEAMEKAGFSSLPGIVWRKPSNSPTKFMGSGMLPAGAYVTLEHEYILIFRKGGRREFRTEQEKERRRASSYFWEERNRWFSDVWQDLRGVRQVISGGKSRDRSAAFPLELPYRLINMFSLKDDTVLDPFLGTGTTAQASIISGRNSLGYEMERNLSDMIHSRLMDSARVSKEYVSDRIRKHEVFVEERKSAGDSFRYFNSSIGLPVKERSEQYLEMELVDRITVVEKGKKYIADYAIREPHGPNPE